MNRKSFTIGIAVGVVGTGILNVVGSLVGKLIATKKAQRALDALSNLDDENENCDTCNCCAETEE